MIPVAVSAAVLAVVQAVAPGSAREAASPDVAACLLRLERAAPQAACTELETRIASARTDADRGALLERYAALSSRDVRAPSEAEVQELAQLTRRSPPGVDVLAGRHVLVLASAALRERALATGLVGRMDACYVVLRALFGVDPERLVGRRVLFFDEVVHPNGWSTHWPSNTVRYDHGWSGQWEDVIAHELTHCFVPRHPNQVLFSGGFCEGWSDFAQAYVGDQLAALGPEFAGHLAGYVNSFAAGGTEQYLATRLPIEEIVAYGPSSSLVMELCVRAGDRVRPDWAPLRALLATDRDDAARWTPGYLWPARLARELARAFPRQDTWDVLAQYRFPLDNGTRRELERWEARARAEKRETRAETWSAEKQLVVHDWRVLGPIPDSTGRGLEFDPLVERTGALPAELTVAGSAYTWRSDAHVDDDGTVLLSQLPHGTERNVAYLVAELPPELAGERTFYVASDDEVALWLDGQRIHVARASRVVDPDEPDRAFGRVRAEGSRLVAQVANYGGASGLHVRTSAGAVFDTAWRSELRSSDPAHRLLAVRYLGSRRVAHELVLEPLVDALSDSARDVRIAAARALSWTRDEERAVLGLIAAWERERDDTVASALREALGALTFQAFEDPRAARAWWKREANTWREGRFVEAEDLYALRSIVGGFYGNNAGCYAGQHVGRCFGAEPAQIFALELEAPHAGPRTLAFRYATAGSDRKLDVRVRRGTDLAFARTAVVARATKDWTTWQWLEIELPSLQPGRYRVEVDHLDGCLDFDVIGWRPR